MLLGNIPFDSHPDIMSAMSSVGWITDREILEAFPRKIIHDDSRRNHDRSPTQENAILRQVEANPESSKCAQFNVFN